MNDYPLAKGHMEDCWATCVCPICDDDMEHVCDEYEEEDNRHLDTYACRHCDILVTYVSPLNIGEYHNVLPRDRRYIIEGAI